MSRPSDRTDAEQMIAEGYRRISNRYRIVSRIDRVDWMEKLAKFLNRSIKEISENQGMWASHYRRCFSEDALELSDLETYKKIPGSDWDPIGYVRKGES